MINRSQVEFITRNFNMKCCGLNELTALSRCKDPQLNILKICKTFAGLNNNGDLKPLLESSFRCAHIVFSQAGTKSVYGRNLKNYIEKHDLGTIIVSKPNRNPNTGRIILAYIWTPNKAALCKIWNAQLAKWDTPVAPEPAAANVWGV